MMDMLFINYLIMRKYLLHVLIISFVFFITPTILAASDIEREIEELKQAIRINPDDAEAYINFGLAYVKFGIAGPLSREPVHSKHSEKSPHFECRA